MYLVVLNADYETWTKEAKTKKEVKEIIEGYKHDVSFEVYKVTKKLAVEDFQSK